MGLHIDLDQPVPVLPLRRTRPGPVTRLHGFVAFDVFWLKWQPPRGGGPFRAYRVERTGDGHDYEILAETTSPCCVLRDILPGEPWFYRVTAINGMGTAGRAREVILYQRSGPGVPKMLMSIPAQPGVRVDICIMEDASASRPSLRPGQKPSPISDCNVSLAFSRAGGGVGGSSSPSTSDSPRRRRPPAPTASA
jgi:hypothetical protein